MVLLGLGRVAQARGDVELARSLGEQSRELLVTTGFLTDQRDVEEWLNSIEKRMKLYNPLG